MLAEKNPSLQNSVRWMHLAAKDREMQRQEQEC